MTKKVSLHVSKLRSMDFINKNFTFETVPFNEMLDKIFSKEVNSESGEAIRYYMRSLGENMRKEVSDIWKTYPELSKDFHVPACVPMVMERYFSSCLRISSADIQMWTHYDIMDNVLCQISGSKKVVLWAPEETNNLYIHGSSSNVLDIDKPDLAKFPKFAKANRLEGILNPGEFIFIPALWFHNVLTLTPCISVNVFWRHLDEEYYQKKDLYGNKDLVIAEKAKEELKKAIETLNTIHPYYKQFYTLRLIEELKSTLEK